MCFYDQYTMACEDSNWGNFRQHCSNEYRIGYTCGMKLVCHTQRCEGKCRNCIEIETKLGCIRKEEEKLHRLRLGARKREQYKSSTGKLQDDEMLQDLFFVMKRTFVLQNMLPTTADKNWLLEVVPTPLPLTRRKMSSSESYLPTRTRVFSLLPKVEKENRNSSVIIPPCFASNEAQVHPAIDLSLQQVRLFELTSTTGASVIKGVFHRVSLSALPNYVALSYAWGAPGKSRLIYIGGKCLAISQNLWWFLHSWDSSKMEKCGLFWIDAICIDQENILERNHQVGLMKQIYSNSVGVILWLGQEANNSDLAMEFMATKGSAPLRRRGGGFRRMWTRDEGKALLALCERPYWRRIWIIQEILHAKRITVLCGKKSFEWNSFENVYGKLKTLEYSSWILHHEYAGGILYSSASVMVWQRAHWRHPETSTPHLRRLLEVFEDWQCSDIRDKVYGLLSMVDQDIAVAVDYSKTAEEIYDELRTQEPRHKIVVGDDYLRFCSLLRRTLKLAEYR